MLLAQYSELEEFDLPEYQMFRGEERPVCCGSVSVFNGIDTIRRSQQLKCGHSSRIIGKFIAWRCDAWLGGDWVTSQ